MKLSILTGILDTGPETEGMRDPEVVLRTFREIGYDTVDLSFTAVTNPDYLLRNDNWKDQIYRLGNTAAMLGLEIRQCHLPFVKACMVERDPHFKKPGHPEYFMEMFRRAYEASAMLGIPFGTVHPMTKHPGDPFEVQLAYNHAFYDPLVEWGIKYGVGTAFENMRPDSPDWSFASRFCQDHRDLIALVDSFNDPMVGICWDTGHANQAGLDQASALRAVGSRLKNLHLNDNHFGTRDQHLLPFMGSVDWKGVLTALVEIDYQGVLNYEVGNMIKLAPWDLQMIMMPYIYKNGCQLLELYEKIKAEYLTGKGAH